MIQSHNDHSSFSFRHHSTLTSSFRLLILFLIFLACFLPLSVFAGTVQLPQTGQTTCYDTTGAVITCIGTGQDGDIQAGVPWPNPRFIDNGNETVTDKLTRLIWIKDANLMKSRDLGFDIEGSYGDGAVSWQKALDYIKKLNAEAYLGYTDWRLPNINELESLLYSGLTNNFIVSPKTWLWVHGFSNVQSFYWSSTSLSYNPIFAWTGDLGTGRMLTSFKSSSYPIYHYDGYVWPIRSGLSEVFGSSVIQIPRTGQTTCYNSLGNIIACAGTGQDGEIQDGMAWPNPRFMANGDCVTDNLTGLMWANTPDTTWRTWQQSLDYANSLSLCGFDDWRLPNRKELHSLIDFSRYNPILQSDHPFMNKHSGNSWSSTSYVNGQDNAWLVSIESGEIQGAMKSNYGYGTWPVRDGYVDSDGDGLLDTWEEFGYRDNGIFVDLPTMGVTSQVTGTTSFPDIRDHHFHDLILY